MIIVNPQDNVLAFSVIDWLVENEPAPKKGLQSHLRKVFGQMTDTPVNVSPTTSQENDDEEEEGEGGVVNDQVCRDALLTPRFMRFSISNNNDIILKSDSTDEENLLFTGADAQDLLPILQSAIQERVQKLSRLLK